MDYPFRVLKRVAIVAEREPGQPGGLAVASERIARAAAGRGLSVHLLSWSNKAAPGAMTAAALGDLTLYRVGRLPRQSDSLMALTSHLRDLIAQHDLQLVHGIYAVHAGYASVVAAACEGVPSLVSVRGNDIDRALYRTDQQPLVSHCVSRATLVTGVSSALCQEAGRVFERKVHYVPNAVDTQRFRPEVADNSLRASLGLADAEVLGFVGQLREKKGMRFLLPAFAELCKSREVRLLLIGGIREDAREAFEEFGRSAPEAASRITIIEHDKSAERLSRLLPLCDVLVFPSLYEGMPNAVLEAMAAARPVLATDVGGHRDLIAHGETGALLKLSDLDRLPEAIGEMLDLPLEKRTELGNRARAHVTEHYSPQKESASYARLYQRALERYSEVAGEPWAAPARGE